VKFIHGDKPEDNVPVRVSFKQFCLSLCCDGEQDTVPSLRRKLDELQIQNMTLIQEGQTKTDALNIQVGNPSS
jgi:hypothetical protein